MSAGRSQLPWPTPALPGWPDDLTAARPHRINRICERQGVPTPADLAYQGGGPWPQLGHQPNAASPA